MCCGAVPRCQHYRGPRTPPPTTLSRGIGSTSPGTHTNCWTGLQTLKLQHCTLQPTPLRASTTQPATNAIQPRQSERTNILSQIHNTGVDQDTQTSELHLHPHRASARAQQCRTTTPRLRLPKRSPDTCRFLVSTDSLALPLQMIIMNFCAVPVHSPLLTHTAASCHDNLRDMSACSAPPSSSPKRNTY
jgi:hypothetical protein